jgi:AraC-like DNA-binding protein
LKTQICHVMKSNYEIVLNDINLNFKDSKYSTSQLFENTGLDKNTARDAIKNKTSRSISNYIRFYRLNYAQELLKTGKKMSLKLLTILDFHLFHIFLNHLKMSLVIALMLL